MEQKWHIRIREKKRPEPDKGLVVQALIAAMKQLEAKDQAEETRTEEAS